LLLDEVANGSSLKVVNESFVSSGQLVGPVTRRLLVGRNAHDHEQPY
jgi:hypothetical protein